MTAAFPDMLRTDRERRQLEAGTRWPEFESWDTICKLYGWVADVRDRGAAMSEPASADPPQRPERYARRTRAVLAEITARLDEGENPQTAILVAAITQLRTRRRRFWVIIAASILVLFASELLALPSAAASIVGLVLLVCMFWALFTLALVTRGWLVLTDRRMILLAATFWRLRLTDKVLLDQPRADARVTFRSKMTFRIKGLGRSNLVDPSR